MDDGNIPKTQKWIEDLSQGRSYRLGSLCCKGLQVVRVQRGSVLCNFFISNFLADRNGNWHVGAVATLIDMVGAAAIKSTTWVGYKTSVNFNISYLSTVKIEEEVEIEAKVVDSRGKLSLTIVEVRKKENREMVALGKQWMTNVIIEPNHPILFTPLKVQAQKKNKRKKKK